MASNITSTSPVKDDSNTTHELISLMQIQIDLQKEKIEKQEEQLNNLTNEVSELKEQMKEILAKKEAKLREQSVSSLYKMAKETAESTLNSNEISYDEKLCMYYYHSTGLYYDPVQKLHYDTTSNSYYTYNDETQEYLFHSKLFSSEPDTTETDDKKNKTELNDNNCDSQDSVEFLDRKKSSSKTPITEEEQEIQIIEEMRSSQPPCVRAIVIRSSKSAPNLKKVGDFFIFTCKGGTIGRFGSYHTITIQNKNVDIDHAKISYEYDSSEKTQRYFLTDLGTKFGTIYNYDQISKGNLIESKVPLQHESFIEICDIVFRIHIHRGLETCEKCEPGLYLSKKNKENPVLNTKTNQQSKKAKKEKNRAAQNKAEVSKKKKVEINKKYCVPNFLAPDTISNSTTNYMEYLDRAALRRSQVGSDHSSFKKIELETDSERASVHLPINEDNKGFRLLTKMGWNVGDSLGATGGGIKEPVFFEQKKGRQCIGFDNVAFKMSGSRVGNDTKSQILAKTQQRFISQTTELVTLEEPNEVPSSSTTSKPSTMIAIGKIKKKHGNLSKSVKNDVIQID